MNTLFFILALMSPIVIGFLFVSLCWPGEKIPLPLFWCRLWIAIGVGLGVTSLTSCFTLVLAGNANIVVIFLLEALLIAVLGSMLRQRRQPFFPSFERGYDTRPLFTRILIGAFYTSLMLALGLFVLRSFENPHGESDAWTFWNARARLFFRAGSQWRQVFSQGQWPFPTYPLQTSMNVLRLWSAVGHESQVGPVMVAGLFTLASIGVVASTLSHLRGPSQGALGGLLLASTPYFLKHGASQYADVPFGFYALACLALLNLADSLPEQRTGLIGLAGLNAGFAAWTKQEGILLVGTLFAALVSVRLLFRKQAARSWRRICSAFMAGLVPGAAVTAYYRYAIAPAPLETSPHNFQQLVSRLTDISRYLMTAKAVVRHLVEPYSLVYSTPIAVLALYAVFLGLARKQFKKPGTVMSGLVLCLMASGYFMVYITTSADLAWLIQTTLSRLFLQFWPATILIALLWIATLEERLYFLHEAMS